MADTLTANRSFWYRAKMRRKGDEFEPRRGDVEYLTSGGNPLATQGTGKDGNVLVSDLRAALG